jgi:hypothetical protein
MEEQTLTWQILAAYLAVSQGVLAAWAWRRTRSILLTASAFLLVGLPVVTWRLRHDLKDNQVAGVVTHLCAALAGLAYYFAFPALGFLGFEIFEDYEIPWNVVFIILFFGGLGVLNAIDLSVDMRRRTDEPGP